MQKSLKIESPGLPGDSRGAPGKVQELTRWTQKVGSRTLLGLPFGDPFGSQVGFRTGPWIKKDVFEGNQNTASLQASFSKENLLLSKIPREAKTATPLERGFKIQVFRNFVFGQPPRPVWDKF